LPAGQAAQPLVQTPPQPLVPPQLTAAQLELQVPDCLQ
jgi:hypothetical protein